MWAGAVILIIVIAAVVIVKAVQVNERKTQGQEWTKYAEHRSLFHQPGRRTYVFGVSDDILVCLTFANEATRYQKYVATIAGAFFRVPMPNGLDVQVGKYTTLLDIALGGRDYATGYQEIDPDLRIRTTDEPATQKLFDHEAVRRAVLDLFSPRKGAQLTQVRVRRERPKLLIDYAELDGLLHEVKRVVRTIEGALLVDLAADVAAAEKGDPGPHPLPPGLRGPVAVAELPAPPAPPPPTPTVASTVETLVDGLEAEGRVESSGTFSIDRDAAREKMKRFRLAEPERFCLALVRAAILRGARQIDVTVDADDFRLTCDGRPFTSSDLDTMYAAMFTDGDDDDIRSRRQLALAIDAAKSLKPAILEIVSGDGSTATELRLMAGWADHLGPAERPVSGTTVHFSSRLRDAMSNRRARLEELLWTHCRHAPIPVTLNGVPLVTQDLLPQAWGTVSIEGSGFRGAVGLWPEAGAAAEITWLVHGVEAARHELDGNPTQLVAVVEAGSRLTFDISQGDVVRDAAYDEVVAAVRAALPDVYRSLGRELRQAAQLATFPREWAAGVLRSLAAGFADPSDFLPEGDAHWLAELPLFHDVRRRGVSPALLIERAESGRAAYSDYVLEDLCIDPEARDEEEDEPSPIVHLSWLQDFRGRALAHRLAAGRLPCVNDRLLRRTRDGDRLVERVRGHSG